MIDTIITIVDASATSYDASKCISSLMFGNKQEQYLQQIATDMKDMKVHIERLSYRILYAVNLDGVHTLDTHKTQYFNDLREIRQLLEPLLSSAMIEAPRPMLSQNQRHVLEDSHWTLNDNVLPQNQLAESHPLVLNPDKPKPPEEPKYANREKPKSGKVFRDFKMKLKYSSDNLNWFSGFRGCADLAL